MIYTTNKVKRAFSDDQFNCKSFKQFQLFLVCFAMVLVMLSLSSLFIEFLGSYSRCRVSNGVMPRILGPTNFYLKFWVNILTIKMLLCFPGWTSECCCVLHQNVDIHDVLHLGSSMMNVWWVYGVVQCVT